MDRNNVRITAVDGISSVALRKESVDRNKQRETGSLFFFGSLSARRAWIEIAMSVASNFKHPVALRKESVDRNTPTASRRKTTDSRSPQGERG